jgi:transposase
MPHPAQQIALQEYIHSVEASTERIDRLTEQILKLLPTWRLAPVVSALQALRGVAPTVASTMVVEVGDGLRTPGSL